MSLPDYDPRGNKDVGDISEPEHGASIGRIVEWLFDLVRWLRQREPVTPGDPFTKFATRGYLVSKGLLSEREVLGDDDDGGGVVDEGSADAPEYVYVHAREMYPSVTDGSDVLTVTEITAAKPNIQYLAFNALAASSADFQLIMPEGWPGNAFTFRIYWTHPTGAGTPTVAWRFQAHSAGDGEDIGSDFADGGMTTDTGGTGNTLYITDQSNAITISGVNAKAGDLIFCRITREATDAADTLTTEARLFAMRFDLGEAQVEFPTTSGISGVGYAYTTTATSPDLAVPAHGAGDLILVFARSAGATIPSTPSGFTSIQSESPAFGNGWRVSWVIDAAGTITTVTSVNAFHTMIHVYSGASGVGANAMTANALGPPCTIPALTLNVTDGTSIVAAFGSINQNFVQSDPTGLTLRGEVADALGGGDCRSWDTASGVTSWSSQTTTWSGGGGYGSYIAVEILAA